MTPTAAPPRRVVVATDLSDQAGSAIRRAAQLATQHHAHLTAIHVLPTGLDEELTEFAHRYLRRHVDEHAGSYPAEAVVRHGTVVHEIIAETVDRQADLLVVGAHGGSLMTGYFLGSTPANLVRVSQIPVLVVKPPADRAYRKVALAVDQSPLSATAAQIATALTPQADHIVVHVNVVIGETLMRMHGASEEQLARLRQTSLDQIRRHLDDLTAGLAAGVVIESGSPRTQLPQLSKRHGADLVALGTGGHTALGYALLGSVTQHVLREATSDVLVVPAIEDEL